jgi:hypothetical protein
MADIAVVFHWPPQSMDPMGAAELMMWHERAVARSGAKE